MNSVLMRTNKFTSGDSMEFKKPSLEWKQEMMEYLQYNKYPGCDLSVGNIILWADFYNIDYTVIEDMIVFRSLFVDGTYGYAFPIGKGDEKKALDAIITLCRQEKAPFQLYSVEEEMYEKIENWYPGVYTIEYVREDADYIYSSQRLASLAGKKLHGKRNHINRFKEHYPDWVYEPITKDNKTDCIKMAKSWCHAHCDGDEDREEETKIVIRALKYTEELGLIGGLIRADGEVIAFTLGEAVTKDTFVVHFEKAYGQIQGAYPMINQQFVANALSGYQYINREEDLGIEGLRKAKLSYGPDILLKKGYVRER